MKLTNEIKKYIDKSVLCWLATASSEKIPNVSPKEIFNHFGEDEIIIANIASPQTIKNIRQNNAVCVSFIDILIQKGFQIKGKAKVIDIKDADFAEREEVLLKMTEGKFPFASITVIKIENAKPIFAPRYMLYSETTEEQQIESAKELYGL